MSADVGLPHAEPSSLPHPSIKRRRSPVPRVTPVLATHRILAETADTGPEHRSLIMNRKWIRLPLIPLTVL